MFMFISFFKQPKTNNNVYFFRIFMSYSRKFHKSFKIGIFLMQTIILINDNIKIGIF